MVCIIEGGSGVFAACGGGRADGGIFRIAREVGKVGEGRFEDVVGSATKGA